MNKIIDYKDFKKVSKLILGYNKKSLIKKLFIKLILPIKYLKFKKITKGADINNERLNR